MSSEYIYDILAQGNCPALVRGGCFCIGNERTLAWDTKGLVKACDAAGSGSTALGRRSMRVFDSSLAGRIAMALKVADDWLIPMQMIDTCADGIWIDPGNFSVRFKLLGSDPGMEKSFAGTVLDAVSCVFAGSGVLCGTELIKMLENAESTDPSPDTVLRLLKQPSLLLHGLKRECVDH